MFGGGGWWYISCFITTENCTDHHCHTSPTYQLSSHPVSTAQQWLVLLPPGPGPAHVSPHCTVSLLLLPRSIVLPWMWMMFVVCLPLTGGKRIKVCRLLGLDWWGYGKDCHMILNLMCSPPLQPLETRLPNTGNSGDTLCFPATTLQRFCQPDCSLRHWANKWVQSWIV